MTKMVKNGKNDQNGKKEQNGQKWALKCPKWSKMAKMTKMVKNSKNDQNRH